MTAPSPRVPAVGVWVYGAAAIFLGAVGLVWDDFAAPWHALPPDTPQRPLLAYVFSLLLLLAGAAILPRRTRRWAALALIALFIVPVFVWIAHVVASPLLFATWGGLAEQVAILAGGVIAFAAASPQPSPRADIAATMARYAFGLCCLSFGAAHFLALKETAAMVPAWLPFGGNAWGMLTGLAHILGGLAILSGVRAVIGARLLTAMYAGFGLLVWLPTMFSAPKEHLTWGGNGINLALVGAAWIVADRLASRADPKAGAPT